MKTNIEVELTLTLDPAHFWTLYKLAFGTDVAEETTAKTVEDQFIELKESLERIGFDEDWYSAETWL